MLNIKIPALVQRTPERGFCEKTPRTEALAVYHKRLRLSKERKMRMYSNAELFVMATKQAKPLFVSNITLSIQDDAEDCADLDAESTRLGQIWDVANLTMAEMVKASGLTQTAFARGTGIPYRTMQGWCLGERECPVYIRFLLAEHYGLI